jgi:SAM-dependent methyltransferase
VSGGKGACRSCGSSRLAPVLDLGATPLANALIAAENIADREDRFPLLLAFCEECALAQITESVPPEKLFSEYLYFSSFSDTMVRHAQSIAERLVVERALTPSSLVLEIASNDGYLLQFYKRAGVPVLGIEPAANVAQVAERERGIPTMNEFFGRELGERLAAEGKRADVLHANNVLAHVPDLNGFVRGIASVLKPDGVAVVEFPYVRDMVDGLEFDTIYHEHFSYFSLTAVKRLFLRHGLRIVDVEHLTIHGGSLRIFASPELASGEDSAAVRALLEAEQIAGIADVAYYRDFSTRVDRLKHNLRALLVDLRAAGRRVAAYGASAKGSTLLNTFEIGSGQIAFVVDRSSYKQGRYTPGTHLPIFAPSKLLEADAPDYLLLLTWNFEAEILAQQAEYRARGGRFIVPIPQLRIV